MNLKLAEFLSTAMGRLVRITVGFTMIFTGVILGRPLGIALIALGTVPAVGGLANFFMLAPLFHAPFRGRPTPRL